MPGFLLLPDDVLHVRLPVMFFQFLLHTHSTPYPRPPSGQRVLAECVLPHLCLDVSRCSLPDFDHAAAHVLSPPLRGSEHIEALWTAIRDGVVTVIGRPARVGADEAEGPE